MLTALSCLDSVRANTHSHYGGHMELQVAEWTEKKLKIVETIIKKIAQLGFENVTTAKIAREAGVGEGTIYRHFQSKDELIDVAAEYAAQAITKNILENYSSDSPVKEQFTGFCSDFLASGQKNQSSHAYLHQYMNSPQGLAYRKVMFQKMGEDPSSARPLFYPLNEIIAQAREEGILKEMPLQILALMTISTLVFVVNDSALGLVKVDEKVASSIGIACWDAVKK